MVKRGTFTPVDLEEPNVSQPSIQQQQQKSRFLDKEVAIKVRPRSFVKGIFVILFLTAIFFAGRWSLEPPTLDFTSTSQEIEASVRGKAVQEPAEKTLEKVAEETTQITGAVVAEENSSNEEINQEETENTAIITNYQRVAFSIDDVRLDWRDTWGKITHLSFSIKNNEAGIVKPHHVTITVEGYDDIEKEITLPVSAQTLTAGGKYNGAPQIPYGFSYNEATAGDLTSVKITGILYDEQDRQMATFSSNFDLSG